LAFFLSKKGNFQQLSAFTVQMGHSYKEPYTPVTVALIHCISLKLHCVVMARVVVGEVESLGVWFGREDQGLELLGRMTMEKTISSPVL